MSAADPSLAVPPVAPVPPSADLTRPALLARNGVVVLMTRAVGLVLSLLVVPLLIRGLGMELYGLLSISWMFLAQLAFLDLGFSAACTRYVSLGLARGDPREAAAWAWTSIAAQLAMGGAAAAGVWLAAPALVGVLNVDPALNGPAVFAFRLFAIVLPLELVLRSLTAVMEGAQRFGHVGTLSLATSLSTNGAYLAGVLMGTGFRGVLLGVAAARLGCLVLAWALARRALPALSAGRAGEPRQLLRRMREMLGFGGWMTANSAAGPLLLYLDRWLISTMLGVAILPIYAVPFSLAMQLTLIPAAATSTLFPAFSALRERDGWERARDYYLRSHRYILSLSAPVLIVLFIWTPALLRLWIGTDFAEQAALPLRLLLAGMAFALVAPVSGAVLQGAGRPDLITRLYLVEIPLNVVGIWLLVRAWGVNGAAAGFAIRCAVETLVLWAIVHRLFRWPWRPAAGSLLPAAALAAVGGVCAALARWDPRPGDLPALAATAAAVALFGLYALLLLLDGRDRAFLGSLLRRRRPSA